MCIVWVFFCCCCLFGGRLVDLFFKYSAIMPTINAFKLPVLEECPMTDFKVTTQKYRVCLFKSLWGNHYCSWWRIPNTAILRHKRLFRRYLYPPKNKGMSGFLQGNKPLEGNPQLWLFLLKYFLNVTGTILKARITKSLLLPILRHQTTIKQKTKVTQSVTGELTSCQLTSYH